MQNLTVAVAVAVAVAVTVTVSDDLVSEKCNPINLCLSQCCIWQRI